MHLLHSELKVHLSFIYLITHQRANFQPHLSVPVKHKPSFYPYFRQQPLQHFLVSTFCSCGDLWTHQPQAVLNKPEIPPLLLLRMQRQQQRKEVSSGNHSAEGRNIISHTGEESHHLSQGSAAPILGTSRRVSSSAGIRSSSSLFEMKSRQDIES